MRVVVSGVSGFLGRPLMDRLRAEGHHVIRLVRRPPRDEYEAQWSPNRRNLEPAVLDGADAVINLSGAGIFDKRWSPSYKQVLRDSRVNATTTIATTMASLPSPPPVLINASGVHWYGDTGEHAVTESSPPGPGFLPQVVVEWEAATRPAAEAGVRVVNLRAAPVLAASGGLLKQMLLPFRLGVGGRLGSGRQYMSWVSLADWLGAIMFLLGRDVSGPVNVSAPYPETNSEFTRQLAHILHRPAVLVVPRFALRVALGEVSTIALNSLRVLPEALTRTGYRFQHPEIGPALEWALRH